MSSDTKANGNSSPVPKSANSLRVLADLLEAGHNRLVSLAEGYALPGDEEYEAAWKALRSWRKASLKSLPTRLPLLATVGARAIDFLRASAGERHLLPENIQVIRGAAGHLDLLLSLSELDGDMLINSSGHNYGVSVLVKETAAHLTELLILLAQVGEPLPSSQSVSKSPVPAPASSSGAANEGCLPPLPAIDDNLFAIHYSQDVPENCPAQTPAVSAIVVEQVRTCSQRAFAAFRIAERRGLHDAFLMRFPELEKELLATFFDFVVKNPGGVWLHWNMRKPQFGFEVLSQRAKLHGLTPPEIPLEKCFDLANYLKRCYGRSYAPHPRFENALAMNGRRGTDILTAEAAAAAWKLGEYAKLTESLSGKVSGITNLFDCVRRGTFQTGTFNPGDAVNAAGGVLQRNESGVAAARPDAATETSPKPRWDRDRRELWLGHELCKHYTRPAAHQDKILAAFEEEGWPARIDDPLNKGKLAKTLETMRETFAVSPIQFAGDTTGKGILWQRRDLPG